MKLLPWKYILVSLLVGLLAGGSIGLFYSRDLARHWVEKGPEIFLAHLDREVHLTDTQHTRINSLVRANRDLVAAYHNQIRKATRADIRALLTPDQQARFDAMIAKHDAERHKREGH